MLVLPSTEEDDLKMWHLPSQIPRKRNVYIGNCIEGQKILKVIFLPSILPKSEGNNLQNYHVLYK